MIKFTDKLPFACVRFIVKYIEENIENFNTRLISRGYPEQMVEKTLREVKYKDRKEALKQKSKIAEGTTTLCVGQFHSTVTTKFGKHNHAQMALLNTNTQRYIQGATLHLL